MARNDRHRRAVPCVITVCQDCEFRHVGCHGSCQPYLDQKKEQDRLREQYIGGVRMEKFALMDRVRILTIKRKQKDERCKGN